LRNAGTTKAYNYGHYLGARYAGRVVWQHGNDYETWRSASDEALVMAVRDGIKAADPSDLNTIELNYEVNQVITASASRDDANWENRIDFDAVYTYNPTYAKFLAEYAKTPAKPLMFAEGQYENGTAGTRELGTPYILRKQLLWSLTSGATSYLYGNGSYFANYPSLATPAAYAANVIDTVGVQQMNYMLGMWKTLPWTALAPDTNHNFLTGGLGTWGATGDPTNNVYATAATGNGVGVAYIPSARTITVNLAAIGPNPTLQWFDPTTNTTTTIGTRSGTQTLTTPGNHADGTNDWILLAKN
jgi:hypothetical protein